MRSSTVFWAMNREISWPAVWECRGTQRENGASLGTALTSWLTSGVFPARTVKCGVVSSANRFWTSKATSENRSETNDLGTSKITRSWPFSLNIGSFGLSNNRLSACFWSTMIASSKFQCKLIAGSPATASFIQNFGNRRIKIMRKRVEFCM